MTNKSQALRFTGWYLLLASGWVAAFHVLPMLTHSAVFAGHSEAHLALVILVTVTAALLYLALRLRFAHPKNAKKEVAPFPDRPGLQLLLIFAVVSTVIFSSSLSIYEVLSASVRQEQARELDSVAGLKEGMVSAWLQERQHDAVLFGQDYDTAQHYTRWLTHRESPQDAETLRSKMENIRKVYDYINVSLLDPRGNLPFHADPAHARLGGGTTALVRQVVQSGEPAISPFYRDSEDDDIHFDILAPMLSGHGEGQRQIGVIVLHASAKQMLFPLIQVWPTETRTAETLLVRKEGDKVVFLNPLRHIANRPLEFTMPITESKLIAAMALRGEADVREGVDYRGVPVLAATRHIPSTDWIMVAKIDQHEVYGELSTQRWLLALVSMLLLGVFGIGLRLYWRSQKQEWIEQHLRTQAERQALRSHYEHVLRYANDIFMLSDNDGHIVDANERTTQATGYSHEELLTMNARQLRSPQAREQMERQWQYGAQGAIYETELMRKDGSTFQVEVSARVIEVEGKKFRQAIIRDISERKQTEEAIRNSRDLLRSVVEYTPVRIFWKDRDLRYLGCNTAFARDAGMSHPQELYGKDDFQMGWREQAELYRADDLRVMDSGEPKLGFEEPQTTPDGRTIWLRTSKVPLRDAEGRVNGVLGIYEDITEERLARDQLRQERDFSTSLIETAQVIVLVLDPQGRIVRFNPFMESLCGYASHEVEGRDWFDTFLSEADREQMKALFHGAIGNIQTHGNVNTLITRDGQQRLVEWYDKTLKDDAGKTVGLLAIGLDVTERKHAEQVLQDEKIFSESLIQSLPAIFYLLDQQGGLIRWNRNLMELRGYTAEQMASANTLDFIYEEDRPLIAQKIQQAFETGAATAEARMITQNGIRLYALNGLRVETLHGLSIIGIGIDITDRKQAEDKLRESEAFTKAVLDNLPVGIAVNSVDPSVTFSYMNDNFPAIYRTSRDKLAEPDAFWEAVYEDTEFRQQIRTRVLDDCASGNVERMHWDDIPITRSGKETAFISARDIPLPDKQLMISMVWDVSERKQAVEALKNEALRRRILMENSHDGIAIINQQHQVVEANPRFAAMLGYTPEEVTGLHTWDFEANMSEAEIRGSFSDLSETSATVETRHRRKDGSLYDAEVSLGGALVGGEPMVFTVSRDITERKQHEIAIQRANRALKTLSAGNLALVQAQSEEALLQSVTRVIVEQGGYVMAWVGYAEQDAARTVRVVGQSGFEEGYLDSVNLTWADTERGQGPTGTAIRTGVTVVNPDVLTNPMMAPWREAAIRSGYRSSLAIPLIQAGQVLGALTIHAAEASAFGKEEVELLKELASDLAYGVINLRTRNAHEQHATILRRSLEQSIQTIASTVEARDPYTAGHQRRVAGLAVAIGRQMGLPEEQIKGLHLAAIIHDLGKIHIPAEILSKPGKLNDIEFQLIKVHPQAGYDILKDVEFPWPIAEMIWQHHERMDGSGYPQGLKGDAILPEARILCVADVVEAMSSHRPYRPGLGIEAALDEIDRKRGKLYDEQVVEACIKLFREQGYVIPI